MSMVDWKIGAVLHQSSRWMARALGGGVAVVRAMAKPPKGRSA